MEVSGDGTQVGPGAIREERSALKTTERVQTVAVIWKDIVVEQPARSQHDVGLDLLSSTIDILLASSHLEYRLLISRRRHDVSIRCLLDAFNRRSLWPNDEAHDTVRNSNLNCGLAGSTGRRGRARVERGILALGSDLREVLGCRQNLPLCKHDVFPSSRDHEHRILAAHWRLDVRVGLRSECLYLTA